MTGGTAVNLLFETVNEDKEVSLPNVIGKSVSAFSAKLSVFNDPRNPKASGSALSWLEDKSRVSSFANEPKSSGSLVKEFDDKFKVDKPCFSKYAFGNLESDCPLASKLVSDKIRLGEAPTATRAFNHDVHSLVSFA